MLRLRYTQLDVFTPEAFGGNQLAVITDAEALDESLMRRIAREMNFSETVFILPPERPDGFARLRIFTPASELPIAGHPVIGATFALNWIGRLTPDVHSPVIFEVPAGPLTIEPEYDADQLTFAWMSQPSPTFAPWTGNRNALAAALNLHSADLRADLPIERGSAGVPFVYIPLVSAEALATAKPAPSLLDALDPVERAANAYLFTAPPVPADSSTTPFRSRMFAPAIGIAEDAATGAAAGPFGAYTVRHGLTHATAPSGSSHATTPPVEVHILQGVEMGRPSRLRVTVAPAGGDGWRVRVGGQAVVVLEGHFLAPDPAQ